MVNYNDPSSHWSTLTNEQKELRKRYEVFQGYYDGEYKKHLAKKVLKNGTLIDDNITLNLMKKVVNKGNNFLFGKGVNWQLSETRKSTQEAVLETVWGNQETQNVILAELGISGGIHGTYFIQILTNPTRLKILDPKQVFVTYDYEDNPIIFDVRWTVGKETFRLYHWYDNQWKFRTDKWTNQKWVVEKPEELWPFEWPFILQGKNLPNPNKPYGLSDMEESEIVDTVNQVASNLNRITRIFAHPVVWGYGWGSQQDVDVTQVLLSTNSDSKLDALELAKDLNSPLEFIKLLRTLLSEITNVPESDPDRLKVGAQSGFALEVLFNDLLLKTGIKRNFYGKFLIELNRRILDLEGFGSNNQTKLYWPNPLPVDETSLIAKDSFEIENGLVSKRTVATRRGYDYEIEQQKIAEERTNTTNFGAALVQAFNNGQI